MNHSDLFTPTLNESHDVDGIDRPWRPATVLVLTFFFGIAAGGTLAALNQGRFGMPHRVVPTLVVVAIVALALSIGSAWYIDRQLRPARRSSESVIDLSFMTEAKRKAISQEVRIVRRLISVIVVALLLRVQFRRQRLVSVHDLEQGSLWVPGTIAAVGGALFGYVLQSVVAAIYW
ncbi:MAG: hypothetical protein AAF488_04570 [Planctomycetota bacterium]